MMGAPLRESKVLSPAPAMVKSPGPLLVNVPWLPILLVVVSVLPLATKMFVMPSRSTNDESVPVSVTSSVVLSLNCTA